MSEWVDWLRWGAPELARLGLRDGCDFLAATAAKVEAADFDTLWDTGRAITGLLSRCDQVEGLAEPVRIIRDLDPDTACPGCGHRVAAFDGVHARCVRCRESWLPLVPLLTRPAA